MEQVLLLTDNIHNMALGKILNKNKYSKPVVIRMDTIRGLDSFRNYSIQINPLSAIEYCYDEVSVKERLRNYGGVPTLPISTSSEGMRYPYVLKKRQKKSGQDSVFYIEDSNDHKIAKALSKRYVLEPYFKTTSSYRLYCTRKEVFYAVKRLNINPDDPISNTRNSIHKLMLKDAVMFPKHWAAMQKNAIATISLLGLDIGAIDFMYNSEGGEHRYFLSRVNPNPLLKDADLLGLYANQIDTLIKERI